MKYIFLAVLLLANIHGFSQQNHFIYIQADNRQPFYVKMDLKLMSSSSAGYLIIPKLHDSLVRLTFGFPKNQWPEQQISCRTNQADAGFLLKNFGEKGWGLFNFQSMELVMADTAKNKELADNTPKNDNDFAGILARVVEDPGLKEPTLISLDPEPVVKEIKIKKSEKIVIKKEPRRIPVKEIVQPKKVSTRTQITRLSDKKTREGIKIVYVDRLKGKTDTIDVVIVVNAPVKNEVVKNEITQPVIDPVRTEKDNVLSRPLEKKADEPVTIDLTKTIIEPVNTLKDTATSMVVEHKVTEPVPVLVKTVDHPVNNANDSSLNLAIENKAVEPVVDLLKVNSDSGKVIKDSMIADVPDKKVEEPVMDSPKVVNNSVNLINDTAKNIGTIIKTVLTGVDTTLTLANPEINKDTMANIVVEKKPEENLIDSLFLKNRNEQLVIDSLKERIVAIIKNDSILNTVITDTVVKKKIAVQPPPVVNSDTVLVKPTETVVTSRPFTPCRQEAGGDDFMGLRKKMAGSKTDNEMLYQAHRAFSKMCYTTKYIERLSLIFTSDEGKYKFFDDAYQYVTDRANFPALVSQLTDVYFINRFKALLR